MPVPGIGSKLALLNRNGLLVIEESLVNRSVVAIRGRAGDEFPSDHGAGAGLVLDDHGLLPFLRQPVGERPGQAVHSASGRIRHDDSDQTGGKILRLRQRRQQSDKQRGGDGAKENHGWSSKESDKRSHSGLSSGNAGAVIIPVP